ncbi:tripartite motif-containing protein 2-like [Saccostrea echinata]|uniref:tripartite motif-containing protein 2-like n=1 Tax=Saccostrea echinata TaxID=191078 RepID=UPI002A7FBC5E|nr:tripartite motif-containing protein 2-like [Saccostrea echinata]
MEKEGQQCVIKCDLCNATENVDSFCKNCRETLCDRCCEIHSKSVASRDHEIISRVQASAYGIVDDMKCPSHGGKHCEMYCVTCDSVVCTRCVTDNHRGHEFDELKELFRRKPKEFENLVKIFNQKITPKYLKECEILEGRLSQIDTNQVSMESEIHFQAEEFKKGIETLEERLKRMLQGVISNEKAPVKKLLVSRKAQYAQLQKAINKMQSIFENQHMTNLPLLLTKIRQTLEATVMQEGVSVSTEMASFEKGEISLEKLETFFGHFCISATEDLRKRTLPPVKISISIEKVIEMSNFKVRVSDVSSVTIVSEKELLISGNKFGYQITKEKGQFQMEVFEKHGLQPPVAVLSNGLLLARDEQSPNRIVQILSNHVRKPYLEVEFVEVTGIHVTRRSEILISVTQVEDSCGEVLKYNRVGEMVLRIYEKCSGEALFAKPTSLTENLNGDIWVVDAETNSIEIMDKYGLYRFSYKNSDILKNFKPHTLTNDSNGNILISDTGNGNIHVVDRDGRALRYLDTTSLGIRPSGIAVEGPGQIWTVDSLKKNCYLLNYF